MSEGSCTKDNLWYAAIVIGAVSLIIVVSFIGKRDTVGSSHGSRLRKTIRDAHEARAASEQDEDPSMA